MATPAGDRVYMLKLPQKPTLPAVRVQRIGSVLDQHLRGPGGQQVSRVQVDSFVSDVGDAYAAVTSLADAIRGDGLGPGATGLWGFLGELGGSPAIRVHNIQLDHDGTPDYLFDELRMLRVRQDYLVHWTEL